MSAHQTPNDMSLADWEIPDPLEDGAIRNDRWGVVKLISLGVETGRTLAAPTRPGIQLTLAFATDGGDLTVEVATPINQSGHTTLLFEDIGDSITLISSWATATTLEWRTLANDGVAAS